MAQLNLTTLAKAVDQASATFKRIAAEAKKAGKSEVETQRLLRESSKKLVESQRALATAKKQVKARGGELRNQMFELGNTLAVSGGQAGQVANQYISLGANMAQGSAIAIGIGVVSLGFLAITKAMAFFNKESIEAEKSLKALGETMTADREKLSALRIEFLNFGKTGRDASLANLKAQKAENDAVVQFNKLQIEKEQERLAISQRRVNAFNTENSDFIKASDLQVVVAEQTNGFIERLQKESADLARSTGLIKSTIKAQEKLQAKEVEEEKTTNAKTESGKRVAIARRERDKKAALAEKEVADALRAEQKKTDAFARSEAINIKRKRGFEASELRAKDEITLQTIRADEDTKRSAEAAASATAASWQSASEQIASGLGTAFAAGVTGAQTMEQAMANAAVEALKIIISTAIKAVMANALVAGSGAASAVAPTPFAGPVLAPIAMAAMLALVMGLISSIPKAARGGLVRGGIPGVDSVPILAQRGEFIIPKGQVDQARSRPEQPQTVIINRIWMPNQIDEMKMSKRQLRSRARLARQGMLPQGV